METRSNDDIDLVLLVGQLSVEDVVVVVVVVVGVVAVVVVVGIVHTVVVEVMSCHNPDVDLI